MNQASNRNNTFTIYREERDGTFDQIVIKRWGHTTVNIPIIGYTGSLEGARLRDKQLFDVLTEALNNMKVTTRD